MKNKIYDCITFFQENLQTELRFNILNEVVEKFIVCESIYDHRGNKKEINFSKELHPKFSKKIDHVILEEPFPTKNIPWENQAHQREYIFEGLKSAEEDDLIMFSDPDEIPNPKKLDDFILKKNTEYLCKICTHINLIYLINLNRHGKEQGYVKKKI